MSLVVLEGLDGSGKGTQARLLLEALQEQGKPVRRVTFPDYASPSSALVKMYLAGEFGEEPDSVNPYAASAFYAVDRFASFRKDWQSDYQKGTLILCDRYVTSNMVYQLGKLPQSQWEDYLSWVEDLEYERLELPRPDKVIYLDMPVAVSQKLISRRYEGDEEKRDIHEKDSAFLEECSRSAAFVAEKFQWQIVPCSAGGTPLSKTEIHRAVMECLAGIL